MTIKPIGFGAPTNIAGSQKEQRGNDPSSVPEWKPGRGSTGAQWGNERRFIAFLSGRKNGVEGTALLWLRQIELFDESLSDDLPLSQREG
jgi:hypothetical protein